MARKNKYTVDYFPHYCNHGKTISIIQQKFGLVGYAVWFKLLEELGKANKHYLDCRTEEDWMYLSSVIGIDEEKLKDILDVLAKLNAIDKKLWEYRIIASENFINNIADAYNRRTTEMPTMEHLYSCTGINVNINKVNDDINTQSKVKYSKEEYSKEENTKEKTYKKENHESIDEIYEAYPASCPVQGRSLGKSHRDKLKIEKLLREKSKGELLQTIEFYLEDCIKSKSYVKNLSTFLNNLPDLDALKAEKKKIRDKNKPQDIKIVTY